MSSCFSRATKRLRTKVPFILLSGIFGLPAQLAFLDEPLRALPLTSAVHAVSTAGASPTFWSDVALTVATSTVWLAPAAVLTTAAVRRAVQHASVDLT